MVVFLLGFFVVLFGLGFFFVLSWTVYFCSIIIQVTAGGCEACILFGGLQRN